MTRSPTARSFEYWLHSSRYAWRPALLSSVATPVLYLAALGVGLGALVDRSDPGGLGGVPYLTFVAPGLLAATAMQIAAAEAGQPVRGAHQWTNAYHAMLATPLGVRDVLQGHLLWILFRVGTSCAIFAAVMAAFGAFDSPWAALAPAGGRPDRDGVRGADRRLRHHAGSGSGIRRPEPLRDRPDVPVLGDGLPDRRAASRPRVDRVRHAALAWRGPGPRTQPGRGRRWLGAPAHRLPLPLGARGNGRGPDHVPPPASGVR